MDSTTWTMGGFGFWDFVLLLLIAGVCGALVGMWRARLIGLSELLTINIHGTRFPILWSIIGSAVFVAVISFIARSRG